MTRAQAQKRKRMHAEWELAYQIRTASLLARQVTTRLARAQDTALAAGLTQQDYRRLLEEAA